jgi:hypothetical protein
VKNSVFYLKGDGKQLRGFWANRESGQAFEYSTNAAGQVVVTEVPLSHVFPDLDPAFQRELDQTAAEINPLAVSHPVYSPMANRQARHIGPYNGEDVTKLESKPGSPYVFYLNTSAVMSGSTPLNGVSKENMFRMWQSVADQYSFLNLNVTTNRAVYDAAKAASVLRTGILNFVNQDGRSFAPIGSFGTTSAGTQYRNPSSGFDYGYGIGMTAAHEMGHQMGMAHDGGGTGGEYYEGIAAYQWGPIMGNYWKGGSWPNQLFTWSRGEYSTANNQQDDLSIMNSREGVPYMADDNPSGKALVLGSGGAVSASSNFGQIERNTDTDTFTFSLSGNGVVNLRIDPLEYLRMLDVDARILNEAGSVVASSNLSVNRSAEFKNLSLGAGNYRLVIQGGAEGTPSNGFSKYSSLGWYGIAGSITGGGGGTPSDPVLTSGVPLGNQSAAAGSWKYYTIEVPAGATRVSFSINGSNGDADLFARAGARPTSTTFGCKSDGSTSVESCSITSPAAGTYHVGIYAYSAFSGLSVRATVTK